MFLSISNKYFPLLFLFFVGTGVQAQEFKYVSINPFKSQDGKYDVAKDTFRINKETKSVFWGRSGYTYTGCGKDWLCIKSFVFNFAVPLIDKMPRKWQKFGFAFLNKGNEKISIFGKSKDVVKIEVINLENNFATSDPMIIYYSVESGIIGFTQLIFDEELNVNIPETYFSVTELGFGHKIEL